MACWPKQYQAVTKIPVLEKNSSPWVCCPLSSTRAQHSFRDTGTGAQRWESALQTPPFTADFSVPSFLTTVLLTASTYHCQIRRDYHKRKLRFLSVTRTVKCTQRLLSEVGWVMKPLPNWPWPKSNTVCQNQQVGFPALPVSNLAQPLKGKKLLLQLPVCSAHFRASMAALGALRKEHFLPRAALHGCTYANQRLL